jgi:hypothetical protein
MPRVRLDSFYFTTNTNTDPTGSLYSPTGLQSYTRLAGDLTVTYGFAERFSAFIRTGGGYVNQISTIRGGYSVGAMDQSAGLSVRVYGSPHSTFSEDSLLNAIDLQIQGDFPAYNNASADAYIAPYLGDGSIDFTGGAFATFSVVRWKSSSINTVLGGGFTYRSANFSSALPWSAVVQLVPLRHGLFGNVAALGMISLKTDLYNGVAAPMRASIGNGGSYITGGVNASQVRLRGELGYKFGPVTELSVAATQSIWGQDTPQGIKLEIGLQTHFGVHENEKSEPSAGSTKKITQGNQGFLNYSLDARIIKANDRLNLVKIDKGSQDGVEAGQVFDIFSRKKDGSIDGSIARGHIQNVKPNEAVLEIQEYYKDVWIEDSFVAKRLVQ